jgi:hypothetical protein
MKLIDSEKLLEWMEQHELDAIIEYGSVMRHLKSALESGTFDPTPPVQPDIAKPGNKVRHRLNSDWGIGKVMAADNNALVFFNARKFDDQLTECEFSELEVITDDQR